MILKAASPFDHQLGSRLPVRHGGGIGVGIGKALANVCDAFLTSAPAQSVVGGVAHRPFHLSAPIVPIMTFSNRWMAVQGAPRDRQILPAALILSQAAKKSSQVLKSVLGLAVTPAAVKDLRVVPEDVGAVDVHWNAVGVAILGDQGQEGRRQNSSETGGFEQIIQRGNLIRRPHSWRWFPDRHEPARNPGHHLLQGGWPELLWHWCQRRRLRLH